METFKAWKELIKAVKGISSAIEGENSEGGSVANDNTNYFIPMGMGLGLVNKNLDATKLAFNIEERKELEPEKVGDIFTQEGVDIINSILSNAQERGIRVFVFLKDTSEGNLLYPIVNLEFTNTTNKYIITYNLHVKGYTSDKFTLDTPMSKEGIA